VAECFGRSYRWRTSQFRAGIGKSSRLFIKTSWPISMGTTDCDLVRIIEEGVVRTLDKSEFRGALIIFVRENPILDVERSRWKYSLGCLAENEGYNVEAEVEEEYKANEERDDCYNRRTKLSHPAQEDQTRLTNGSDNSLGRRTMDTFPHDICTTRRSMRRISSVGHKAKIIVRSVGLSVTTLDKDIRRK